MSLSRFEEELRRAGVNDAPTPERRSALRARVLEAAGVGATAAASVADAAAASANTTSTAAGQALTVKSGLLAKVVVGATSALVVGGAVVVMIASQGSRPSSSEGAQDDAMVTASPRPIVVTPPEELSADIPPSVAVSALPNASSPVSVRPQGQTRDVGAEAALLEAARLCVERDELQCADASLAQHARRFPNGALLDEAEVLRIELARRSEGDARARVLAEQYLSKNSSSPYAKRVRRMLDGLDGGHP